jgi:hypothetical protein
MHNVFLSYGRGSTGRAVATLAGGHQPPLRKLERWAREKEVCRFAGEHAAGAGAPLGIAAAVAGNLNVPFRVR